MLEMTLIFGDPDGPVPIERVVAGVRIDFNGSRRAMQSGILFGYAAMVDGMVEKLSKEMEPDLTIIATGGLSSVIAGESKSIGHEEPYLTLNGLRIIFDKNRKG